MTRLRSLLAALVVCLVAGSALGAYVLPDSNGRDGWLVDEATGNLIGMRADTVVLQVSSTGDLTAIDDFTVTDDLTVGGLATIGETLTVTGATALNGGLTMDTNKFTVADTTGNTQIAGTLNADGNVTVNTNKVTVTAASGNTDISGTLQVDGNVTVGDGSAGVDYVVTVNGEDNDLTLTYGEDEDTLTVSSAIAASQGLTVVSQTIGIDFSTFRIHDNIDAFLDQAAADDDDLTLVQGTFGTAATTIETIDCGGLADTSQLGAFWFVMPPTYLAGSTVTLKVNAGMVTTVADQAATIDFECYVPDYANADATVSTDLITTAATSVNFTTFADYSYTLDDDASGYELDAGTVVQCRTTFLCDDDGNAGDGITIRANRLDVVISQ